MEHLYDYVVKGGAAMYPILLCSIIAVGVAVERLVFLAGAASGNRKFLKESLEIGEGEDRLKKIQAAAAGGGSPLGAVVAAAIKYLDRPDEQRNALFRREGARVRRDLEKNVNYLGIISKVAPLLGLLGTVTGMIRAFMTIQALGGQVDAVDLAGGIWEALITTAAGLMVGIPALLLYHLIDDRIDSILTTIKDGPLYFPDIMSRYDFGAARPEKELTREKGD